MSINIGNLKVSSMFVGNKTISKIFLGNTEIWSNRLTAPILSMSEDGHHLTLIAKDLATESFDLYSDNEFKYNIKLNSNEDN